MKTCIGCKHAQWKRTASSRLHPSGDGRCLLTPEPPSLPEAYYWITAPLLGGGYINRNVELAEHCAFYARGEPK